MSGGIHYEVLVTGPDGATQTTRHASKEDARLEVERVRRFHPESSARMELLEEPEPSPPSSPRDFDCPHCKAPAGSPCMRPSEHPIPFGDSHAARKDRVAALPAHTAPPNGDPSQRLVCCPRAIHLLLCHLCGRRAVAPISERDPGRDCPECGSVMLWEARECVATPSFPGHGRYDANGPVRQKPPSFEPGVAQGSLF